MRNTERLVASFAHALGGRATVLGGLVELALGHLARARDGRDPEAELQPLVDRLEQAHATVAELASVHRGLLALSLGPVGPLEVVDLRVLVQQACIAFGSELRMRCRLQIQPGVACRVVTAPTYALRAILGVLEAVVDELPTRYPLPKLSVEVWADDECARVAVVGRFLPAGDWLPGLAAVTGPLSHVGGLLDTRRRLDGDGEVTIVLPLVGSADDVEVEAEPGRVLVVDDDAQIAHILVSLFEAVGCEATWVCGGHAALDKLSSRADYDLVLIDRIMPGLSGEQLYERLVEVVPHVAPRVVLTSAGEHRADPALQLLAPCPSVPKPTTLDEVRAILRMALPD